MQEADWARLETAARPALLAFARKQAGDTLAEDMVQEALLQAYRKRDKYDPARGTFLAWTQSLLMNKLRDYYRSARSHEVPFSNVTADGDALRPEVMDAEVPDPADVAIGNVLVAQMIDSLRGRPKKVVKLLMKGHTHAEVAAMTGCNRQDYARTLRILAKRLHEFTD